MFITILGILFAVGIVLVGNIDRICEFLDYDPTNLPKWLYEEDANRCPNCKQFGDNHLRRCTSYKYKK
jgi:hypothetical protein